MLRRTLFIDYTVNNCETCFLKSTERIKKQMTVYRKSIKVIYYIQFCYCVLQLIPAIYEYIMNRPDSYFTCVLITRQLSRVTRLL